MTETNAETPITRKEIYDAAEAIMGCLERTPGAHNAIQIDIARTNLRRILLGEIEKPVAPHPELNPAPRSREITDEEAHEFRMNQRRAGLPVRF
jgi:pyruvate-formate lyase